ncbi:MAG: hypothetical protein C0172_02705 [Caldisphaera sp.]|nr:MAG: hypothetical protein C0172_02705 [Caldisphaera sp.]
MTLKLSVNKKEIITSIVIIVILALSIVYISKAREYNDLCSKVCFSGFSVDGSIIDALLLREDKLYCTCYTIYGNSKIPISSLK